MRIKKVKENIIQPPEKTQWIWAIPFFQNILREDDKSTSLFVFLKEIYSVLNKRICFLVTAPVRFLYCNLEIYGFGALWALLCALSAV